jgi:hypothetical protein
MRFLRPAILALLVTACASNPTPQPTQPTAIPRPVQRGTLIGLTIAELGARFGQPAFQVREGPGLKLQWSTPSCVLDTYLYPPASGGGTLRVTFVDARRPSGDSADQTGCIAAIDAAG